MGTQFDTFDESRMHGFRESVCHARGQAKPPPYPIVIEVIPPYGTIAGGTAVTVVGNYFENGATVTFDSIAATDVVWVNAQTITCTTPAHAAGYVDVEVTNPGGAFGGLVAAYEYVTWAGDVGFNPDWYRRERWQPYPTTLIEQYIAATDDPWVGKGATASYAYCFRAKCWPGAMAIPAHVVVASLHLYVLDTALQESLGAVRVRLGGNGLNWEVAASWDVEGRPLLGASGNVPAPGNLMTITLDADTLTEHAGEEMQLVLTTQAEEAKAGGYQDAGVRFSFFESYLSIAYY